MNYVIIGTSAAGIAGARSIRRYDSGGKITLISQEGSYPYCRCLTSYFLAGELTEAGLSFCVEDIYRQLDLETVTGEVVGINLTGKRVKLSSQEEIVFDKLLVASGANPVIPTIPGIAGGGAYPLRTLQHAREMLAQLPETEQVVVLGGGLVSLKGAAAFAKQGKAVTVIVSSGQVLSQVLDEKSSRLCQKALEQLGVVFRFHEDVVGINRGAAGKVSGVTLTSGRELPCQLVLFGKGVVPNTQFMPAEEFGLEPGAGLTVNSYLETGLAGIYAAGDVVQTYDLAWRDCRVNALWPNAAEQGKIAGANMAGQAIAYQGSIGMNAVDFPGFRVIAAGITRREPPDCTVYADSHSAGEYSKLVFRGEQLVGYILTGDHQAVRAGYLTQLIKSQQPAKQELITGRRPKYLNRIPAAIAK